MTIITKINDSLATLEFTSYDINIILNYIPEFLKEFDNVKRVVIKQDDKNINFNLIIYGRLTER